MLHILPKPSAVLFDWDSTLADTAPGLAATLQAVFRAMAREGYRHAKTVSWPSLDHLKSISGFSPPKYLEQAFGGYGVEVVDLIYQEIYPTLYQATASKHLKIYDGVMDNLRLLKNEGVPFAIVSSKRHDFLVPECQRILGGEFPDCPYFGARKDIPSKPEAQAIHEATAALGVATSRHVWMIGDTEASDIQAALNAGCTPILIRPDGDVEVPTRDYPTFNHHRILNAAIMQALSGMTAQQEPLVIK